MCHIAVNKPTPFTPLIWQFGIVIGVVAAYECVCEYATLNGMGQYILK